MITAIQTPSRETRIRCTKVGTSEVNGHLTAVYRVRYLEQDGRTVRTELVSGGFLQVLSRRRGGVRKTRPVEVAAPVRECLRCGKDVGKYNPDCH